MSWLYRILRWVGLAYELLTCVVCGAQIWRRGDAVPPGWARVRPERLYGKDGSPMGERPAGWLCPRCGP